MSSLKVRNVIKYGEEVLGYCELLKIKVVKNY